MFKGKRFKQQSQLNASTSENELFQTSNVAQRSFTNRKRSREDRINRSDCAKRYRRAARSKKSSLQHRYNPQQSFATQKPKEESQLVPCKTRLLLRPNMSNYLNKHFPLKIKQASFCQEVTPVMRLIIIDWLMQVADDLSLRRQAIHTAIHYLDQMLHKSNITKKELQVHGLCCLMIAQKLESQKILTPFQACQLLNREVSQRQLIETEGRIMKTLEFKLHPVTLWTEMSILLKAFQTYFKDKIGDTWRHYKHRALWIIDGICLETKYFSKYFPQKQLCLALLFSIVSQYQDSLLRYFTGFCRKITGKEFEIEENRQELKYLQVWLQRKCLCQDQEYSPEHYHAQLKKMAALGIHS